MGVNRSVSRVRSKMESQTNMDEDFLGRQQCQEREGDGTGHQCELPADHIGVTPCACSVALNNWLRLRYGDRAAKMI